MEKPQKPKKSLEQLERERRERKQKLELEAKKPLSEVLAEAGEESYSDRAFAREFKKIYSLKAGLNHLRKQKQSKIKTNKQVYNDAVKLIKDFAEKFDFVD